MDYRRLKHFARINYKDIRDRKQSDLSVNRKSQTANIDIILFMIIAVTLTSYLIHTQSIFTIQKRIMLKLNL